MRNDRDVLLCPSAQPGMAECQVLGVVEDTADGPRLSYLNETLSATADVLKMAEPVNPTEVFRLAAHCEQARCTHFDGERCQLVTRIVQSLAPVSQTLPPCVIRPSCRWYEEEGKQACLRCPQVVTANVNASEQLKRVAGAPPVTSP